MPVFTMVDTVGAYPSFDSETNGQSEVRATLFCYHYLNILKTSFDRP